MGIMVCGILDDASAHSMQNYTMGRHTVSHESQNVRHVGGAMVIFDPRRVSPLFEVSIGDVAESRYAPIPNFDWVKWAHKVDLVTNILYPTPAEQGPRYPLMRHQKRHQTVMAYLQR